MDDQGNGKFLGRVISWVSAANENSVKPPDLRSIGQTHLSPQRSLHRNKSSIRGMYIMLSRVTKLILACSDILFET